MLLTLRVLVGWQAILNWLLVRPRGRGMPLLVGLVLVESISFLIWRRWGFGPQAMVVGQSFRLLRDLGLEEAALGVNTQNLSGLSPFRRLGLEKVKRWTDYRKPLEE